MKVYILQGSHKKNGNTWQFTRPFVDALQALGAEVREGWLCDYDIKPCLGCKSCQNVTGELGCAQKDDFETLFGEIQASDILVLAAPIYCGVCPGSCENLYGQAHLRSRESLRAAEGALHAGRKILCRYHHQRL